MIDSSPYGHFSTIEFTFYALDRPFFGHGLMWWTVVAIAIGDGADGEAGTPSPVSNARRSVHCIDPIPPGLRLPPLHLRCSNSCCPLRSRQSFPALRAGAVMAIP